MSNSETSVTLLLLKCEDACYGLSAKSVLEVSGIPPIVKIPRQPEFMLGIAGVDGVMMPVFSLNALLGGESGSETVCIQIESKIGTIGIAVTKAPDMWTGPVTPVECSASDMDLGLLRFESAVLAADTVFVLDVNETVCVLNEKTSLSGEI